MQPFPNTVSPFVSKVGKILNPWIQYLQQFTQAPPSIMGLSGGGVTPLTYTAKEPGYIIIVLGVISGVTLVRGTVSLDLTGQKIIPVSINDIVIIDYSLSDPTTVFFVPIYGSVPG